MFPELHKLLELERLRLERERLKLRRKALHKRHRHEPSRQAVRPADTPKKQRKPYTPQNKAHRTYDGYRTSMIGYEDAVREVVGHDGKVTHQAIYADAGGPSPKTQGREMALYGLHYDHDWPPRTWPNVAPVSRNGTN